MTAAPRIDSYLWRGGREAMLRWGPENGPVVVLALPLFEEANRTRALAATLCRALAERDIGSVLPDLPGQGESLVATERATLADLRDGFQAVPGSHTAAIRSGALLVDDARPGWMLSPQSGADLVRELGRMKVGALEGEQVQVAGNLVSRDIIAELAEAAHPGGGGPVSADTDAQPPPSAGPRLDPGLRRGGAPSRTVRLSSDGRPADHRVAAAPLWRRAEPGNDPVLAQLLADDIAEWIATCGG